MLHAVVEAFLAVGVQRSSQRSEDSYCSQTRHLSIADSQAPVHGSVGRNSDNKEAGSVVKHRKKVSYAYRRLK